MQPLAWLVLCVASDAFVALGAYTLLPLAREPVRGAVEALSREDDRRRWAHTVAATTFGPPLPQLIPFDGAITIHVKLLEPLPRSRLSLPPFNLGEHPELGE